MAKSDIVFFSILSIAFAAPSTPSTERIVGGAPTNIQEYPYIASLQLHQFIFWGHACGGSLITRQTILSAAICFYNYNLPSVWRVRLGSSHKSSEGKLLDGRQINIHEDYNPTTFVNDIAILKLNGAVTYSESIQPIFIPPRVYNIPDNTVVSTVGWGTLTQAGLSPEQLQHVNVNVINQKVCADRYVYLATMMYWPPRLTDGMICTGILDVGGKDACQGDFGGPITFKTSQGHVAVGLASWSYGCAHALYPRVSTRTSHYSDWIVKNGST